MSSCITVLYFFLTYPKKNVLLAMRSETCVNFYVVTTRLGGVHGTAQGMTLGFEFSCQSISGVRLVRLFFGQSIVGFASYWKADHSRTKEQNRFGQSIVGFASYCKADYSRTKNIHSRPSFFEPIAESSPLQSVIVSVSRIARPSQFQN